jgi:1,4-alpha-glucan branching enzyme
MIRPADRARLLAGEHSSPHSLLGLHPANADGKSGAIVRAFHPDAVSADCLPPNGDWRALEPQGGGLFSLFLPGVAPPCDYRLRFRFGDGNTWERRDPYRFLPTLGDMDLYLFGEGNHRELWKLLGAHPRRVEGIDGVSFAVWAPNARRVSVVGDFCRWDGRLFPMRQLGASGIFELFVPDVASGALYKYELLTQEGMLRLKADPLSLAMERPPGTASRVVALDTYRWSDREWMSARLQRDPRREPMLVYEAHVGSWARVPEEGNRSLTYREIAPRLAEHVKRFGFTHVELLPVMEHPFEGSWGYQVSGYYAPSARFGSPDDFRYLVDTLHRAGIGVILDWVPAHFPKDDFALRRFDGTPLYEHADPRKGEQPDWGTLIFNYGRNEVRNFLLASALYWLEEFHIDGLRVDAVASMLYLDYSRKAGEWIPNRHGGRENLEAINFLTALNTMVTEEQPGCFTVAEESTAWPGVTRPTADGGLGFTLKWNMGWMHDTLHYFALDPVHRRHHQNDLTFSMLYEYSECFLMPLSHDEVVHGKGSLLNKMAGDLWQKFANLRLLLAYQYTRPGKKLLFMGTELAADREWNHDGSLDWHLAGDPMRSGLMRFLEDLGGLYRRSRCLWRSDPDPEGFRWIDCEDRDNSVLSYVRRDRDDYLVVLCNFTPVPREGYRIGVPDRGDFVRVLSSDDSRFGGSGMEPAARVSAEPQRLHGFDQSISLLLPPLAAVILSPAKATDR